MPTTGNVLTLVLPKFYPKQVKFLKGKGRYIAFGGARPWWWLTR